MVLLLHDTNFHYLELGGLDDQCMGSDNPSIIYYFVLQACVDFFSFAVE